MKFHAGFSQPFLNIHTPSLLGSFPFDSPSPLGSGSISFLGTGFHLSVTVVIQATSQLFALGPIFPPGQGFQLFHFSSRPFAFTFAFASTPRTLG